MYFSNHERLGPCSDLDEDSQIFGDDSLEVSEECVDLATFPFEPGCVYELSVVRIMADGDEMEYYKCRQKWHLATAHVLDTGNDFAAAAYIPSRKRYISVYRYDAPRPGCDVCEGRLINDGDGSRHPLRVEHIYVEKVVKTGQVYELSVARRDREFERIADAMGWDMWGEFGDYMSESWRQEHDYLN